MAQATLARLQAEPAVDVVATVTDPHEAELLLAALASLDVPDRALLARLLRERGPAATRRSYGVR